jgi:hypothetical protein
MSLGLTLGILKSSFYEKESLTLYSPSARTLTFQNWCQVNPKP